MVFSSLPAYLDPSNWHQQPQNNHQLIGTSSNSSISPNPRLTTPLPLPPPAAAAQPHGGGSIRPGSMSERARMANIPMPETALKCPRCESTNTKFCYFNNYSLTQPRHFCKTCRRYWTRGGALRNVPVGGGCRRNKRSSKSSSSSSARSKSPASVDRQTNASTSAPPVHSNSGGGSFLGLPPPPPPPFPPLRFTSEHFTGDLGLNYGGIPATTEFPFGANLNHNFLQQFPILNGFDPSGLGLYQFHQGGDQLGFMESEARPKLSSSLLTQLAAVKMEENPARMLQGGAMAPPLMASDHHWNGGTNAAWTTELSGFSSSSATSNHQLQ